MDDLFFGSLESSNSNLSNIFGITSQQSADTSLKYSSPKQVSQRDKNPPSGDQQDGQSKPTSSWDVQIAVVVTAFKILNQENIPHGKLGFALLKSGGTSSFKIILYKTKTNVQCTLTLSGEIKMYLKNSYLQFADDSQFFWSILFEANDRENVLGAIRRLVANVTLEEEEEIVKEEKKEATKVTDNKQIILSRITKMGQPLPKLAQPCTTTDMSDSSDTEVVNISSKPVIAPRKPRTTQVVALPTSSQTPVPVVYTATSSSLHDSQYMNILLSENRTQNCEIRMNLSKLENKIEKVLDKIDLVQSAGKKEDKEDEMLRLEEKILELKKENRCLKKAAIVEKEFSLIEFNQYSDLLNSFELNETSYKNCEEFCSKLLERTNLERKLIEEIIQNKESQLESKSQECEELKTQNVKLTTDLDTMSNDYKKEISEKKNDKEVDAVVKEIMTKLYSNICDKFDGDRQYTVQEILKITGYAIKQETKNALNGIDKV